LGRGGLDGPDRKLRTPPCDCADRTDQSDCHESALARLSPDPAESIDANDPMLPMENNEPMLPIEPIDPTLATERIEPREPIDKIE
jgi:hypothetical protein